MKRRITVIICALAAVLVSCTKEHTFTQSEPEQAEWGGSEGGVPLVFSTANEIVVTTRTAAIEELVSFNVVASRYSAQTGWTVIWNTTATKSGDYYVTDKYWPAAIPDGTKYKFTASNLTYSAGLSAGNTFNENGDYYVSRCGTDWVIAGSGELTQPARVSLNFSHLVTRIGTCTIVVPEGFTADIEEVSIDAWNDYNSLRDTSLSRFGEMLFADGRQENLWIMCQKGMEISDKHFDNVSLYVSYTLENADINYSEYWARRVPVYLEPGKLNNITVVLPSKTLEDGFNAHSCTLDGTEVYFANTDLVYDGTEISSWRWHLHEYPWSYEEPVSGRTLDSYSCFDAFYWGSSGYQGYYPWLGADDMDAEPGPDFTGVAKTSSSYGSNDCCWTTDSDNWDWGRYNDVYSYTNERINYNAVTRILTIDEWWKALDNSRMLYFSDAYMLATVNGYQGTIIFSDDYVHPSGAPSISSANQYSNVISASQWKLMQDAGAVFLVNWVEFPGDGRRGYWTSNGWANDSEAWGFESDDIQGPYRRSDPVFAVRLVKEK